MVMSLGRVMTGATLSTTVTVKVLLEVNDPSLALAVTVVTPSGKTDPEAGLLVVETGRPLLFTAEVTKFTTVPAGPAASTMIGAGTVMTGGPGGALSTVRVTSLPSPPM